MLTSFIKVRNLKAPLQRRILQGVCIALGLLLLASCGKKDTVKKERSVQSKYDESLRDTTGVGASETEHVIIVPGSPEAQEAAKEAGMEYFSALKLMKEEKYEEALELFIALEEKHPVLSGPVVNQAIIYLKQENFEDAEQAIDRAIAANPLNPFAHNLRGIIMRDKGEFAESKAAYQQALTLDVKYAKAHYNLAVLGELYIQDLPLALNHFKQYQNLQKKPDQTVDNWIKDLERRVAALAPPPPVAAPAPEGNGEAASAPAE